MRRLLALFATGAALTAAAGAPAWAQADELPIWHDADGPEEPVFVDPRPIQWHDPAELAGCLTPGALLRWPDDALVDSTEP